MSEPVIKCESVYKIFGENAETMLKEANGNVDAKTFQENGCIVGVNNASFEVSKGEMLVVMGLSGSGKSTLIRHINRLIEPTEGSVLVDDQDITKLDKSELLEFRRNRTGMVFQRFALVPHHNIIDNVKFGLSIKNIEKINIYFILK